ncbi:predicted protein [Naegleria gruberi]|uniref:Predicted protein n=1 Tax=Naegleria gruberi TaxID=5762 RepID=D2VUB9_NAEGR|nr:uncharacterized protein NAEGRDRAFT_72608 [Naegleria gruberi]EFC39665.1 predicted protein [Naegleria gruberi]|eukprot:XP_002672409.1 predicted protein [Naegleria gruberi strain NEG-M]
MITSNNFSTKKHSNCPTSFFQVDDFHKKHSTFNTYPYDPSQFRNQYDDCLEKADYKKIKRLRILVQRQTIDICRDQYYLYNFKNHRNSKNRIDDDEIVEKVSLKEELMIQSSVGTLFIRNEGQVIPTLNSSDNSIQEKTRVLVINGDCVDVAFKIQDELVKSGKMQNERVAILNMANPNTPGGGYQSGCGAQEENLFRRSNLYQCLDNKVDQLDKHRKWSYPIGHESACFSPNVLFFRGCEAKGYPLLQVPRLLDVITAAAVPNKSKNTEKIDGRNNGTIEAIFKVAILNGVRNLVLSAFGCGAFKNNPNQMAKAFKTQLEKYEGYFDRIYFAIIEDHNSKKGHNPDGNIEPFLNVFKDYLDDSQREEDFTDSQYIYSYENVDDYYENYYSNL